MPQFLKNNAGILQFFDINVKTKLGTF